jgi:hypothetical protein
MGNMPGRKFRSVSGVQPGSPASCSAFRAGDPDRYDVYPVFATFGGYFLADAGEVKPIPSGYDPPLHPFVWQWFDAGGKPSDGQMR